MIYAAIVSFCMNGTCREIHMKHHYPTLEACEDGKLGEASDWLYANDPEWKWHYGFARCEVTSGWFQ